MIRSLVRLVLVSFAVCAWVDVAQAQMTPVAAPSGTIQMGGVSIASGTTVWMPVDAYGHPIPVTTSGGLSLPGSPAKPVGYSCAITSGGISSCNVPDEVAASPSGFRYDVTITDSGSGKAFTLRQVPGVTGSSAFRLDQYTPIVTVPTIAALTYTTGSGAPTGACTEPAQYFDKVGHALYECSGGVWVQVSGPGGGSSYTFPSGVLAGANSTSAPTAATSQQMQTAIGAGVYDAAGAAAAAVAGSMSGNAATATALHATPTLCSTGNAPTGVLANGNATGCAPIAGGGGQSLASVTYSVSSGTITVINNITGSVIYTGTDLTASWTAVRAAFPDGGLAYFRRGTYNFNTFIAETTVHFDATVGVTTGAGTTINYGIGFPATCGTVTTTTCQWTLQGETGPTILYGVTGNTQTVPTSGVIFNVTPAAISSVTAGNMIVPIWARPNTDVNMDYQGAFCTLKDFGVRFPDNQRGNEEWIDVSSSNYCVLDGIIADTNVVYQSLALPVPGTLGSYGIATTHGNAAGAVVRNSYVMGPYVGYDLRGENTIFENNWGLANTDCLDIGFRESYIGNTYHGIHVDHQSCGETQHGVTFGPGMTLSSEVEFTALDFEDATSGGVVLPAFSTVYHMKEVNPTVSWGTISYSRTIAGVGNSPLPNPFDGGGGQSFRTCTLGSCTSVQSIDYFKGSGQLDAHKTNQGQLWQTWAQHSGECTNSSTVTVTGSGVVNSSGSCNATMYIPVPLTSANSTVCASANNPTGNLGISTAMSSSADTRYDLLAGGSSAVTLYAAVAGTYTSIATGTYSWTGSHRLCLTRTWSGVSNLLTATIDGAPVTGITDVNDSSITASGYAGITISGGSSVAAGAFSINDF